jgi:hypothetical protein
MYFKYHVRSGAADYRIEYIFFGRILKFSILETEILHIISLKMFFCLLACLFVCLFIYNRMSNFSAIRRLSPLPMTGLQIYA